MLLALDWEPLLRNQRQKANIDLSPHHPVRAGTKVASKIAACVQFIRGGDAQSRGSLQRLSHACPS